MECHPESRAGCVYACVVSADVSPVAELSDSGNPKDERRQAGLSAPTPKDASGKPDLSGLWVKERSPWEPPESDAGTPNSISYYMPPGSTIAMKPEAAALYKQRYEVQLGAGRPSEHCLPHSIPDQMFIGVPMQLVQTKGQTIMLWEEFTHYRMIYTDGRTHPKDPNPTWFGYSIGSWDGDTFAVDTRGFNDKSWLDDGGHPHTEAMHTIEKFRRPDFGHLKTEITIDDPGAYEKPVTLFVNFRYFADTVLIESICDNEKDSQHQVGR